MCKGRLLNLSAALGVATLTVAPPSLAQTADNAVDSQRVSIQFEGMVGNEAFACGETYRVGTENSAVTPLDFRFYVSEVALIDAEGNAVPIVLEQDGLWQHQNVALLDFEDKTGACANGTTETRSEVTGAVPAGDYTGLKFTFGVPFGLNHIDSTLAPSPLNLTSLWWNWNAGYKFARIDMQSVSEVSMGKENAAASASAQAFLIHIGSVGCQMNADQPPINCSSANRSEVTLADFDPDANIVVTDLSALLANTNLDENQEGTAAGCMSSPNDSDCMGIMQSLGIPFQDSPAVEQTFFSVQ